MPFPSICTFLGSPEKYFFDKLSAVKAALFCFRFFEKDRKFTCNIENKSRNNTIARAKVLEKTNVFREAEFPLDRKGMDIKMANNKNKKNAALNSIKMQAANEVGVPLKEGYNGDLTAKQVGSVGGQMVKKMIESYENSAQ